MPIRLSYKRDVESYGQGEITNDKVNTKPRVVIIAADSAA